MFKQSREKHLNIMTNRTTALKVCSDFNISPGIGKLDADWLVKI